MDRFSQKMIDKVAKLPDLRQGERLQAATWGLGKGTLAAADIASRGLGAGAARKRGAGFAGEADTATAGSPEGMADEVKGNGIFALTQDRLLWCKMKTAVGKPKSVTASWSRNEIKGMRWQKPILAVDFADGSSAALHLSKPPDDLLKAFSTAH